MNLPAKKITREELYDRLWATPFVRLGKELGYSYVELVRICARLKLPRPSGGYWYRLAHGGGPEQTPIPPGEPDIPTEIELGNPARFEKVVEPEEAETAGDGPKAEPEPAKATGEEREGVEGPPRPAPRPAPEQTVPREAKAAPTAKERATGKVEYTRRQLYEAVWSTPCSVLAKSLGLSDVGLAKTCKRLRIPRPTRGYWARVAAGEAVEKRRLPPAAEEQNRALTFDVAANTARREGLAETYVSVRGLEELAVDLELPEEGAPLHRLAERHREALAKLQAGGDGLVHLRKKELFRCDVAPSSIGRLCRALHALIEELEARGYKFRGGSDNSDTLRVVKKEDGVSLSSSELLEHLERQPSEADRRRPSWTWQLKETKATGRFSIGVHAFGLKGRRDWTETETRSLGEVLGIVVEKVDGVFQRFEEMRQQAAEEEKRRAEQQKLREKERIEEEKRRAEQEKQRKELERLKRHETKLQGIEQTRRENLVVASRRWADVQKVAAYIEVCESLWRKASRGELSTAQSEWLSWAKQAVVLLDPATEGYPDPIRDGKLDRASIAVGGPYPETRILEESEATESDPAEVKSAPGELVQSQGWDPTGYWGPRR